jgi:di/tricarboxylate transporter
MMIPVVKDLSQRTGLTATKLLMPMSFASILGGASTLIGTSTNLIIAGLIVSAGLPALNIFAPTLVALPAAILGIIFLMTIGNRLLPSGTHEEDDYKKRRYKAEFMVIENSNLIGKTIKETGVILGAPVGLSTAVTATGLSDMIAQGITAIGGSNPFAALVMVFLGCVLLTNVITNAAAASIMFPVAISLSTSLGVSFTPFAVALMLGTSYAFINPAGYQTNLMVQEPGNYTFIDFARLGLPLTLLVGAIVLILTPIIYQF